MTVWAFVCCCLTTKVFIRLGNRKCVADCKIGQLKKKANSKQNSYTTLIGVHEMHG